MTGFRRSIIVKDNRRILHLIDGDGNICLSINIWLQYNLINSIDVNNFCFPYSRIVKELDYLINATSSNVYGKVAELLELPFDV